MKQSFRDTHNVKVVTTLTGDALYFSREPIPSSWKSTQGLPMHNQMGIIAFRREALIRFNQTPETALERFESVDMNRVVETGAIVGKIKVNIEMTPAPLRRY